MKTPGIVRRMVEALAGNRKSKKKRSGKVYFVGSDPIRRVRLDGNGGASGTVWDAIGGRSDQRRKTNGGKG